MNELTKDSVGKDVLVAETLLRHGDVDGFKSKLFEEFGQLTPDAAQKFLSSVRHLNNIEWSSNKQIPHLTIDHDESEKIDRVNVTTESLAGKYTSLFDHTQTLLTITDSGAAAEIAPNSNVVVGKDSKAFVSDSAVIAEPGSQTWAYGHCEILAKPHSSGFAFDTSKVDLREDPYRSSSWSVTKEK
jgi:hypothetical protein